MTLPYPPPFMDLATLAVHICAGESTIEGWVKRGTFPAPVLQGGKRLWEWKAVQRHLAPRDKKVAGSADAQAEGIKDATRRAIQNA